MNMGFKSGVTRYEDVNPSARFLSLISLSLVEAPDAEPVYLSGWKR